MFGREPKGNIEEFCKQFYDRNIFHAPAIASTDAASLFCGTYYDTIVKADPSFAWIDKTLFRREMDAIRLELFAFAWDLIFRDEKFKIPQSVFTRRYLEKENHPEYWDIMCEYNRAVAQSATMDKNGKAMEGRQGQARITFVNSYRFGVFKEWNNKNKALQDSSPKDFDYQGECLGRVINRLCSDIDWADGVVKLALARTLASRLGYGHEKKLNTEAASTMMAIIFGLYKGATETIQGW